MADQQVQGMLVQIEATTAQLRRELANADQLVARSSQSIDRNLAQVDSAFDRAGNSAQQAGNLIRGAFAAVAGAGLVGGIIKQVDAYGQMSDRMKAAAGSGAEYQLVQEHLLQTANETYRPLAEAQELYIRTAGVMRNLGYDTQKTLDITDSFSFLLVTNAASADKAGSALDAYSKALQTGKVEADGWVSIQTAMPTIVDAIAAGTGKSAEQIRKLGVEGKLALDDLNNGLLKTVDTNRQAAAEMSTSVQDALTNIGNAISTFLGNMEESTGVVGGLSQVLLVLGENVELVASAMGVAGVAALTNYVAKSGLALKAALAQYRAEVQNAQAAMRAAEAQRIYAQAQLQQAEATVVATTGLQRLSIVKSELIPKQAALKASTDALAIAQANLTRAATGGLLAAMGGPMGIAMLAGTAAASFLLLRDNSDSLEKKLGDLNDPLDKLVERFGKLNKATQAVALRELKGTLEDTASELSQVAGSIADRFENSLRDVGAAGVDGFIGALVPLPAEAQKALDLVRQAANEAAKGAVVDWKAVADQVRGIPGVTEAMAQAIETGQIKASELSAQLQNLRAKLGELTEETDRNTASTQANTAAKIGMSSAGQTYLDTLQKQLGGLQDNNDAIKIANRYIAEHADLTDTDRNAILSAASAIESQKKVNDAANKAKRKGESESEKAAKKQLKDFESTEEGFKRQIQLINTTGDRQKDATEVAKLSFELQEGKLGNLSKAQQKRLLELAAELDGLNKIKKANEDALKLSAFKAAQSSGTQTAINGYAQELAGIGMGDKARDRMRADLAVRQKYVEDVKALNEQRNTGQITPELYASQTEVLQEELNKQLFAQQLYYEQVDELQTNWVLGAQEAWQNYADAATNYSAIAADATASTLGSARSELGAFFTDMATGSKDAGDALADMVTGFGKSVISTLADMAAQWLIYQAVQLVVGKTTQSSASLGMVANAQATAFQAQLAAYASTAAIPIYGPALAPAAALTAAAATAPMVAGVASTSAMAGAGFMDGGYTGHGRRDEVAGPVHRGEYVFDAEATARIGVGNLEALSDGRIGMIGQSSSASAGAERAQSGAQIIINSPINVQAQQGVTEEQARRQGEGLREGFEGVVRDVLYRETQQGGLLWRK